MCVCICIARAGQPKKRGDKEARQLQIHRKDWSRMDLSDGGRGCGGLQLHATHAQAESGCC